MVSFQLSADVTESIKINVLHGQFEQTLKTAENLVSAVSFRMQSKSLVSGHHVK